MTVRTMTQPNLPAPKDTDMTHHFPTPEHKRLYDEGMYRPDYEGDACGVGLVAAINGQPQRRVVAAAVDALKAVWHRGAVDADGKTGDGAGIHVDLPVRFFDDAIAAAGQSVRPNRLAVGMKLAASFPVMDREFAEKNLDLQLDFMIEVLSRLGKDQSTAR